MNNGTIAPHEGREIDLVLAGEKPLAVIEKRKDPEQYARALAIRVYEDADEYSPVFVTPWLSPEGPEVVVYQLASDFHKYRDALAMPDGDAKTWCLGKLFGYSDEDIAEFITNPPACDCSKCSCGADEHASDQPVKNGDARRTQFHAK